MLPDDIEELDDLDELFGNFDDGEENDDDYQSHALITLDDLMRMSNEPKTYSIDYSFLNQMVPKCEYQYQDSETRELFNYAEYRLSSMSLFQKKTAQLGLPPSIILMEMNRRDSGDPLDKIDRVDNLPSKLLRNYLITDFTATRTDNTVATEISKVMSSVQKKETAGLLLPVVFLSTGEQRNTTIGFEWKESCADDYSHVVTKPNSGINNEENAEIMNGEELSQMDCTDDYQVQKVEHLENIPSVLKIEKLDSEIPFDYYYNRRLCTQIHPFLCLQTKPSDMRRRSSYNIAQNKKTKKQDYYFYFEYTILDSDYTNAYGGGGISEIGIGYSPFEYIKGMTGWYSDSIGYHQDCGRIYQNIAENDDKNYAGKGKVGDTIGAMWCLETGTVQFTRNGVIVKTKCNQDEWKLDFFNLLSFCPTISCDFERRRIYVNVGLNRALYPFKFFQFNTYDEQEQMYNLLSLDDSPNQPFVDIEFVTVR